MKFVKSFVLFFLLISCLKCIQKLSSNEKNLKKIIIPESNSPNVLEAFKLYGQKGIIWDSPTTCLGKSQSPINIEEPMTYAENLELNVDNMITNLAPGTPMKIAQGTFRLDASLGYVVTRDPILYHEEGKDVYLKFNCLRIVFHSQAEHSLYGTFPDVEMQIECELETNLDSIAEYKNRGLIISYFFNGDERLDQEDNKVGLLQGFNLDSFTNVSVDIFRKMLKTDKFVLYEGSRSQPPCTENYLHIVDHRVYKVPKRVVLSIKDALNNYLKLNFGNARPIQKSNGRPIVRNFDKPEKPKLISRPLDFQVSAAN